MLRVHKQFLGSIAILRLQGRIVRGDTAVLWNAVNGQSEVSAVVLDLARVSTIDAGGLGVMLQLLELTQSRGIDFMLMNMTKLIRQLFEITRLNSVFEVVSCEGLMATASQRGEQSKTLTVSA